MNSIFIIQIVSRDGEYSTHSHVDAHTHGYKKWVTFQDMSDLNSGCGETDHHNAHGDQNDAEQSENAKSELDRSVYLYL